MLRKRIIGVVTIRNGLAVQSIGYKKYRPLGRPESIIENLNRWAIDEILIQVIDAGAQLGSPDFQLLKRIQKLQISTPIIYSGGVLSVEDGLRAVELGADRLVLESLLRLDHTAVTNLSELLGAQAIIVAMSLSTVNDRLFALDYRSGKSSPVSSDVMDFLSSGIVSELLVIDWKNEGRHASFDNNLPAQLDHLHVPLILFGGISEAIQVSRLLAVDAVHALAIGNFLSHREHAVQRFKEECRSVYLRPAFYAGGG